MPDTILKLLLTTLFIYLAASGFSCRMWDHVFVTCKLSCSMRCLSCSMWNLVPWPRIKPGSPSLEAWGLYPVDQEGISLCEFWIWICGSSVIWTQFVLRSSFLSLKTLVSFGRQKRTIVYCVLLWPIFVSFLFIDNWFYSVLSNMVSTVHM